MAKRLFGTNGVRGVVGQDMNPDLALRIGLALGTMRKGRIGVGRDSRTSGPAIQSAVEAGLLSTGCDVVDCGILPTPALQYLVRSYFDGGAMITASHNPPEYNGIKVIEPDGTEMGDEETVRLENILFSGSYAVSGWDGVGKPDRAPTLAREYETAVTRQFPPGIGKGIIVAVDPGCGAAAHSTASILTSLGCGVHTINATFDGRFPGRLPEPSPEGLEPLSALVRATGAAFGVAHDGDADRAVFVDDKGRFLEENREFALIADEVCKAGEGWIVTPVSTSVLVGEIASRHGCRVRYTPVGSIYVARTMLSLIKSGERVIFGGEGNGGLIYPDHQFCRDGGMTAAMMVSLVARTGKPLSALADALPPSYMIKEKVRIPDPKALVRAIADHYAAESPDLTDGVRINRGKTWALVRPSGTEPLVRVMVESGDRENAAAFHREISDIVSQFLMSHPGPAH